MKCGDGIVEAPEVCDDEYCGDGTTQISLGEECDDGNTNDEDGCSSTCKNEYCGDGIKQGGLGEQCDDGNDLPGGQCTPFCQTVQ